MNERLERASQREPGLYPFGTAPIERLSIEAERAAPFEVRLRSVWKYIVQRAKRFTSTLSERERAHLDAEDLVSEIVVSLIEKDHKWNPTRARYVTFCETVMRNVLSIKREQARVVVAPANAQGRLKKYRQLFAEGKLSVESQITMRAIEAALGELETVNTAAEPSFGDDRPRDDTDGPMKPPSTSEVKEALKGLTDPRHALVLGQSYGLYGEEKTTRQIADQIGSDPKAVRALAGRAKNALRQRIEKLREKPE